MIPDCFRYEESKKSLELVDTTIKTPDLEAAMDNLDRTTAEKVETLVLSQAVLLQGLPPNIARLSNLSELYINQLHSLEDLGDLNLPLKTLEARQCTVLKHIPFGPAMQGLESLDIAYSLNIDPDTPLPQSLKRLNLEGCLQFQGFKAWDCLPKLGWLSIKDTGIPAGRIQELGIKTLIL